MMLSSFRALLVILLALPVLAQQTARKTTPTPASKPLGITMDDVLAMVEAGISDELIIAKLRKEGKAFDLGADDIIRLKKGKVSEAVTKVMLDPKAEVKPVSPVAADPASQPLVPQALPPTVIQAPVVRGLPGINPSGATPAPGANTAGDMTDPSVPHDSGIYLYTKDREGKPQMIVLERAAYQGAKTGGMLSSSLTYGIKKVKTKAVIPGTRAGVRVSEASPVFYFYFDDKQAGLGKTYFGVGSLSNPNQFALLKLEVNKSNRETIVGQFSMLGSSSGSDAKAMMPFKSERIRAGLYKVTVESLKPGEYCFYASSGGVGAATPYGVAAAGATGGDIFDFGVSVE